MPCIAHTKSESPLKRKRPRRLTKKFIDHERHKTVNIEAKGMLRMDEVNKIRKAYFLEGPSKIDKWKQLKDLATRFKPSKEAVETFNKNIAQQKEAIGSLC